ncbi:serine/threonine-protein phosphatase PGAM5, mitochondrial [Hylobates moloch]|uniref:serine/threonine-protein phosphatase PGAM5, mitochondrial n=1 Tax=Hylobates moloch TaxID=81572 RepID=UPI002674D338|nr:serine/threonine-protein phosphatase PGAM5, mitochondrial [Hylobates moloch]
MAFRQALQLAACGLAGGSAAVLFSAVAVGKPRAGGDAEPRPAEPPAWAGGARPGPGVWDPNWDRFKVAIGSGSGVAVRFPQRRICFPGPLCAEGSGGGGPFPPASVGRAPSRPRPSPRSCESVLGAIAGARAGARLGWKPGLLQGCLQERAREPRVVIERLKYGWRACLRLEEGVQVQHSGAFYLPGREQAELTGLRLASLGLKFNKIVHSSMTRAIETTDIISRHLPGVCKVSTDLLREGAPIEPDPPVSHWKPEAVQYYEDGARIEAAFRNYIHRADARQEEDSYEIFICHANVIRYIVCRALQFPPEGWLRLSLNNGSITHLVIRPNGRVALRTLGDTGFMPPDKITRS